MFTTYSQEATPNPKGMETPPTSPDSPEYDMSRTVKTNVSETTDLKQHFKATHRPKKEEPPAEPEPHSYSITQICGVANIFGTSEKEDPPVQNEWGVPPVAQDDESDFETDNPYEGGPTPDSIEDYEMILHENQKKQQAGWRSKSPEPTETLGITPRSASFDEENFPRSPFFSTQAPPAEYQEIKRADTDVPKKSGPLSLLKRGKKADEDQQTKKKRSFKKLFRLGKKKNTPPPPPMKPPPTQIPDERIRVPRRPLEYDPQLKQVVETEIQGSQAEQIPYALYDSVKPRNLEPLYPYPPKNVEYDPQLKQVVETELHGSMADRENRLHRRLINQYRARRGFKPKSGNEVEVLHGDNTLRVPIPGETSFLSDGDLIGEIDEYSASVKLNKYHGLNERERSFLQAMEDIENEPDYIQKALTWNDEYPDEHAIYRQNSAPGAMLSRSFSYDKNRRKKTWRAAIDPETGREYYYNRLTRSSTWTRPPEDDLLPPKEYPRLGLDEEKKDDYDSDEESDGPLRKKYPSDFDADVWEKKLEIYDLLQKMSPPDGTSVKRLIKQFDGREDELLEQLREMSAEKPFDEMEFQGPLNAKSFDEGRSVKSYARTVHTNKTGLSMLSDMTPQIRNGKVVGRGASFGRINENPDDDSISSEEGASIPRVPDVKPGSAINRPIPRKIVPRTRELVVEDLSQGRYYTQVYDKRNDEIDEPKLPSRVERLRATRPSALRSDFEDDFGLKTPEQSDHEQEPEEVTTPVMRTRRPPLAKPAPPKGYSSEGVSSITTDTDVEYNARKIRLEQTKKRALNQALAEEDWDRAERLTLDLASTAPKMPKRLLPAVVTTRELDRYVSDNDWNAVHAAIGKIRAAKELEKTPLRKHGNHRRLPSDGEVDIHPITVPPRSAQRLSRGALRLPQEPSPSRPPPVPRATAPRVPATPATRNDDAVSESSYESENDDVSENSYSVYSSDSGGYSTDDQLRSAVVRKGGNGTRREFAC